VREPPHKKGIKAQRGGGWGRVQVRALLLRPRNTGLRAYHGEIMGPATWKPIVSEEDWRAQKAILENPARRISTTNVRKYLMVNLATCGECGGQIIARWNVGATSTKEPRYLAYTCGNKFCISRTATLVDTYIGHAVVERFKRPDARELLVSEVEDALDFAIEIEELNRRMDEAAKALRPARSRCSR